MSISYPPKKTQKEKKLIVSGLNEFGELQSSNVPCVIAQATVCYIMYLVQISFINYSPFLISYTESTRQMEGDLLGKKMEGEMKNSSLFLHMGLFWLRAL